MVNKTLDLDGILNMDTMACEIANLYTEWCTFKTDAMDRISEIRKYLFATDTTTTTNNTLPWKNKTTLPKLTQIRDNLYANYMASLFPKRKWLYWDGATKQDAEREKAEAVKNLANYWITTPEFKLEIQKVVQDYVDTGNCFIMPVWEDRRQDSGTGIKEGYAGPLPMRISPLDIVFNPTASSFLTTPKIIRSIITFGELRGELEKMTNDDNRDDMQQLFNYLRNLRQVAKEYGDFKYKDEFLNVDGFSGFQDYLSSSYVELLTFYGDLYDIEGNTFYKNKIITIVDRHKIVSVKDNPTSFGYYPIFHCGWRTRQDNLWAMGPLDNLIGLQYRLDHIENMKADLLDLITLPMQKVKGYVHDYEYGPLNKIYCPDPDSDVEFMRPPEGALQVNIEIQGIQDTMEAMAGSPKEAMGFRTPGEKTAYEVSRLENAAARMFQAKIIQFEEQVIEPLLNAMLDLAQRLMGPQEISVFDEELKVTLFQSISKAEITGHGRIRPVAARNFAERAERVQNLTNFYASALGQDPEIKAHISTVKSAQMIEDLLDLQDYEIVQPYVRLAEQAEAQAAQATLQEQTQMQGLQSSGLTPEDTSQSFGSAGAPTTGTPNGP